MALSWESGSAVFMLKNCRKNLKKDLLSAEVLGIIQKFAKNGQADIVQLVEQLIRNQ